MAQQAAPTQAAGAQSKPEPENARKTKRLTVRIDNEEERAQLVGATLTQLVQTFRGAGGAADSIIAARCTKLGDIILQTATVEAREELERKSDWVLRVSSSARLLRQTTQVIVHGVRIAAIDNNDQEAAISILTSANKKLHPELEIVRTEWPSFAYNPSKTGGEKKFSSLIVEVAKPEEANRLIDEGIVVEDVLLFCGSWIRNAAPQQCFNCYGYGHIGRTCKNMPRCGFCARGHRTQDHGENQAHSEKCAVCEGGHPAWSKSCPVRQREAKRIKNKLETKAKYYRVPTRGQESHQGKQYTVGSRLDSEGFQLVVPSAKRKALAEITNKVLNAPGPKRGRPTRLSILEKGQKPLQTRSQDPQQEPRAETPAEDATMHEETVPPPTQ